ncbi:DUF4386 domain-containing protein [Paenibacillus sp. DXFW5]|uniref:DUF4386 domain-containing protein n=1 Tax=Paenibacillus rhizolycopersici TaxID=2780073 RepID=A0ABS2H9U0_9BACL|nr:DUF4386 domain-containing protein [Paenibacillus rhizolycopersici]MBM6996564.1 DUF4386 domain-containing protein [Paenibacillus rhizolycopersici]
MKAERVAGVLFFVSTGAFLVGSGILDPILHRTDILVGVGSDRTSLFVGGFLEFINAIAVVGIAMLLHPTLKKYHEAFAFGYFASRVMESAILMISLIGPLLLLALSQQSVSAGVTGDAYQQTLGSLVVETHELLFDIAMLVLSVGSLLFCSILYQSRLVPRWLSVIGFIGYASLLASSFLSLGGLDAVGILYLPGAIFEIVLPVWLILKGFQLQLPVSASVSSERTHR